MKLLAVLLLAALAFPAVLASGGDDFDIEALVEANPGWGRRQLLKRKPSKKPSGPKPAADKTVPLGFTTLTRSGATARQQDPPMGGLVGVNGEPVFVQKSRGGTFGKVVDPPAGNSSSPYYVVTGQQEVSTNPDYTSILPVGNKLYSFVHFEGPLPSQLYFMELIQEPTTGAMHVSQQTAVDWSKWGGLWLPCAGSVSPWGTHLGSEEYEPDARPFDEATSLDGPEETSLAKLSGEEYGNLVSFVRYFGLYYPFTLEQALAEFNPYHYGFVTELVARNGFKYTNKKLFTLGRISHEMADVMPDQRTVYMTDDGTNTALWKYVADKKGDLTSGKLYIAKVTQRGTPAGATGPANSTSFNIDWLLLGAATQAQIDKLVNKDKLVFSDIFDVREPAAQAPFCDEGFTSINAGQADANHECLRVKTGMKTAAAFLESRRYGALIGGTTEWSKLEGMVFNAKRRTLAFAASDVRYGMENNQRQGKDNNKYDIGGSNDIRLTYNQCGCVYEIQLDRNYDSRRITPLVCGKPSTAVPGNTCDVDGIASPDNLALIPEQNTLIIGEDTSNHQNDMLWAYDYQNRALTRIATSPYGSEYTSVDWYELGDWGYLTAVIQHPYGESDQLRILDGDSFGLAGTVGYIGPISLRDIKGKNLAFASLPYAKTNSEKHNIRVSATASTS